MIQNISSIVRIIIPGTAVRKKKYRYKVAEYGNNNEKSILESLSGYRYFTRAVQLRHIENLRRVCFVWLGSHVGLLR